jgi:hypothetical protein
MIYETYYGHGWMTCPLCLGKGHRIGAATTTAAECWVCLGRGEVGYSPKPAPPQWTWPVGADGDRKRVDQ